MEEFLIRALLGGLGVAVAAGPLGCLVVWRRMAYFGATLAHSALLGVALGFVLGIHLTIGILLICFVVAVLLGVLERRQHLATDTLLGVLAHVTLAVGLVVLASMETLRVDLMGYLFGDILAIGRRDLLIIGVMTGGTLGALSWLWRDLLSMTVSEDLAAVEGVRVRRVRTGFIVLLAGVVAVGMKVVGILLVISLLIVPAAAARAHATTPEGMAIGAGVVGCLSVVIGLLGSVHWDVPTGPLIVVVAAMFFVASLVLPFRALRLRSNGAQRGA